MSAKRTSEPQLPAWLIPPFILGSVLALGGGYFDDAWHTERGRDSFFITPHIAIYAGVTLAGGALGLWTLLMVRRYGLRRALAHQPLLLALLSVTITLASAPIDNAWHLAFGRDAVIWSPPHVLGIVGTAGLATAILVELVRSDSRWGRALRPVGGALILAAFSFLVVEYQTDVPQFPVLWYLPVLTLVSALALTLVRLATGDVFAATQTAFVHLLFIAVVSAGLLIVGFDAPQAPLLVFPALALDLLARRRAPRPLQAALFVAVLFAAYLIELNPLGHGVDLSAEDVAVGLPMAFIGAATVLEVVRAPKPYRGKRQLLTATGLLTLMIWATVPGLALAHDPGQGPSAGTFHLNARVSGSTVAVVAMPHVSGVLDAGRAVARRAGVIRRASVSQRGDGFTATLELGQRGRWFLYVDLQRGDKTIESWMPIKITGGSASYSAPHRFAYLADRKPSNAVKWTAGIAMYLIMLTFVAAMVVLVRRLAGEREVASV